MEETVLCVANSYELKVEHASDDFAFDEIGSVLKIKELQRTKEELFESLELYYKVFFLGEELKKDERS